MAPEIITAKIESDLSLTTPMLFAGVATPEDGIKRNDRIDISIRIDTVNQYSKVVVSACEGHATWTHLGDSTVEVLNVVPSDGEVLIRLYIDGVPIDYRMHIIAYTN